VQLGKKETIVARRTMAFRWKQTIMPQARKQGGSVEINYLAAGAETGRLGSD